MGKRENDLISGFKEEDNFANSIMIQFGYDNPILPTKFQDRTEHWDLKFLGKNMKYVLFDVKGKKNNTYEFHDIEFQNNSGNLGWLLGKATHIAFRISDIKYCVVKRKDLLKYSLFYIINDRNENIINNYISNFDKYGYDYELKNLIDNPNLTITDRHMYKEDMLGDCLYIRYKRSDFHNAFTNKPNDDIIMLIKTSELLQLEHVIVNFCIDPMIYKKQE